MHKLEVHVWGQIFGIGRPLYVCIQVISWFFVWNTVCACVTDKCYYELSIVHTHACMTKSRNVLSSPLENIQIWTILSVAYEENLCICMQRPYPSSSSPVQCQLQEWAPFRNAYTAKERVKMNDNRVLQLFILKRLHPTAGRYNKTISLTPRYGIFVTTKSISYLSNDHRCISARVLASSNNSVFALLLGNKLL